MTQRDDDEDDDDLDPEGPDPSEMDATDEPDLAVCPNCRKMISEETERCPYCGEYVTSADAPLPMATWVFIVVVVVALVLLFVVRR